MLVSILLIVYRMVGRLDVTGGVWKRLESGTAGATAGAVTSNLHFDDGAQVWRLAPQQD